MSEPESFLFHLSLLQAPSFNSQVNSPRTGNNHNLVLSPGRTAYNLTKERVFDDTIRW
jgi:hypothetical protein